MNGCTNPIPFETLVELWAGSLAPDAADALDEHLFSCAACARASEQLGMLVVAMRELVPPVISHAQRDAMLARGLRIKETDCAPDRAAEALFAADVDFLVHVLHADLAAADRIDVEVRDRAGTTFMQFLDVPFDAARGEVLVACQRHYRQLASMADNQPIFRISAIKDGEPRIVGDYPVTHLWPD